MFRVVSESVVTVLIITYVRTESVQRDLHLHREATIPVALKLLK